MLSSGNLLHNCILYIGLKILLKLLGVMKRKNITNSLKKNWLKGCLLLTFALFSTSVSATITVEASNKSIKEILKVIETKSEYRFFYNESLQELNKRSSIKVKNVSIDKILSILLDYTEIEYKLNKKNLVVLVAKIKVNKKLMAWYSMK